MKLGKLNFPIYSIVENGVISSKDIGEGRLIPALVIDVRSDKEIEDLIIVHKDITSGDAKFTWVRSLSNLKYFILKMEFLKPMNISFGIMFIIDSEYSLIDGILESKGFYLQTGKIGDKIVNKNQDPKILVEVPNCNFETSWNKILYKTIRRNLRKKGISKSDSLPIAKDIIKEMRSLWKMRR